MLSESNAAASSPQGTKQGTAAFLGAGSSRDPSPGAPSQPAGERATQRESEGSAKPTPHPANRSAPQRAPARPQDLGKLTSVPRSHPVQQSRRAARHRPHLGLIRTERGDPCERTAGPTPNKPGQVPRKPLPRAAGSHSSSPAARPGSPRGSEGWLSSPPRKAAWGG